LRARHEEALSVAWYVENLSRTGRSFKDLGYYLKAMQPAHEQADDGARALRAMIQRKLAKQRSGAADGAR
jgi:hypothetical protein